LNENKTAANGVSPSDTINGGETSILTKFMDVHS
jgi:hypothetical protein